MNWMKIFVLPFFYGWRILLFLMILRVKSKCDKNFEMLDTKQMFYLFNKFGW